MSQLSRRAFVAGAAATTTLAAAAPFVHAQKRGGTLTIVRPSDPISLDPQLETTAPGAWVYFNMLESLFTLDEKMQVQPKLATGYEVLSPTKVESYLQSTVIDQGLRGYDECFGHGRINALRAVKHDTSNVYDATAPFCPEYNE